MRKTNSSPASPYAPVSTCSWGRSRCRPGAREGEPDFRALQARLDPETVEHLVSLYGGEAHKLLGYTAHHSNGLEKIYPAAPGLWAQAYHAVDEEWAVTVEDVLRRRTTLGLRGLDKGKMRDLLSSALPSIAAHP